MGSRTKSSSKDYRRIVLPVYLLPVWSISHKDVRGEGVYLPFLFPRNRLQNGRIDSVDIVSTIVSSGNSYPDLVVPNRKEG